MKILAGFIGDQLENRVRQDPELIDKPITIFYDYSLKDLSELNYNLYNFLFIQEPNEFFGLHDWTLQFGNYFDVILTWSQSIINTYPDKTIFFPFAAGDYLMPVDYHKNKKFEISFMCGPKNMIYGHQMRHRIFNKESDIKIPTKFFFKGEKRPCWNSMYHIAVENSQNKGYFTEKIIDAFLSKTIPVYWGCSNINEFFNMDGVIRFNNENDLINVINNLTPEYYETKKVVIEYNYKKAIEYADFLGRINNLIKELCNINGI